MTVRFSQAIRDLADLEAALEEDPSTALSDYDHLTTNAQQAIDRRGMFLSSLASRAQQLQEQEERIKEHRKRLESAHRWFTAQTLAFIKEHSEWTWEGFVHRFKVVKNGGKQAVVWSPMAEPTKLDRVLSDEQAERFGPDWTERREVYVLKAGYEDAVRAGSVPSGALTVLPRGERLVVG